MARPSRVSILRPHPLQQEYFLSETRFNVVPAGRRSGKTELFKRRLVWAAMRGDSRWDRNFYFAGAPTRDQAKRIYWADLKAMVPPDMVDGKPRETELIIHLVNGSEIHVIGMDKPERIEGSPWNFGGLDEYGNMKSIAWPSHVRPALSDRLGSCDFIGVPEGRNHYYDLYKRARAKYQSLWDESDWRAFTWKSAEILPPEEVEAAREDLDELTFQQEYEASFVSFQGRAYYNFNEDIHCQPLHYDERETLVLCFDFNIAPGTASIIQEQKFNNESSGTGVIGEVHIPRNSNTERVCDKLIQLYGEHKGPVRAYGDATGGAGGSAKVRGSDWDIVNHKLRPVFGDRLGFRVPRANPRERVRVNSVNARLLSASGNIRMKVDPLKAPNVVKDFEGVRLLEGGSGEIDKKSDPSLTHLSDGIGYYLQREIPTSGGRGTLRVVGH